MWVAGDVVGGAGPSVEPGVMLWNGRSLSFDRLKAPAPIFNTVPDGHGGIWAVAREPGAVPAFEPEIWHYTGGRWRSSHVPWADGNDFVASPPVQQRDFSSVSWAQIGVYLSMRSI